ncbi:PIG-L family deacetylase [Streptomyces sp. ET3-23]|uniref:PIG-L deacetylase family protein n=1 Tax=Streptomyces sp. ET3-23 TaxID=2885643 RepID=UPI001D0F8C78|nr:PIG-L deacetylase family protein [Streptomyces sp. ET3-23]MCC2275460.1 PIG-L family deacetylase [Streptomyces sp. ET3-23]
MFGLKPGDRVLAVAPHPDDETLGAGGTLARLSAAGIDVHVLAVACLSQPRWGTPTDSRLRREEFDAACDVLGVRGRTIAWSDVDPARNLAGHLADLVRLIEAGPTLSLAALEPAALLIPAAGAVHQDHQLVHQAAYAAARPTGTLRHWPQMVLGFHGPEDHAWSPEPPRSTVLVDITGTAPVKDKALECYAREMREHDHPRSLARIRAIDCATGAACGTERAEAFVAYRMAC